MSFSWVMFGVSGIDLLKKYDIHHQMLGLADDRTPYDMAQIRAVVCNYPYADRLKDAAQDCVSELKSMIQSNLSYYFGPTHECPSCNCNRENEASRPFGMDIQQARRFLAIPLDEISSLHGGY